MNKSVILQRTKDHLKKKFAAEGTGHDWWHIERVLNNATAIAKREKGADLFIVQLGALLHDIADWKFHGGDDKAGNRASIKWLKSVGADEATIKKVVHIVDNVTFKGLGVASKMQSLEGKIVQDADRLDAIGAMGIARAFSYGGHTNRPLHNPEVKAQSHKSFKEYKKGGETTINHFYEKLLHLKDLMNTKAGRKMALERHKFLVAYLKEFYAEWNGTK